MREVTELKFECDKCGDIQYTDGEPLPDGWKRIKKKDYCPKCARLMDKKIYTKYPSDYLVHTPSGVLYACASHTSWAKKIYSALGCHIAIEPTVERIACINCINGEKKEESNAD